MGWKGERLFSSTVFVVFPSCPHVSCSFCSFSSSDCLSTVYTLCTPWCTGAERHQGGIVYLPQASSGGPTYHVTSRAVMYVAYVREEPLSSKCIVIFCRAALNQSHRFALSQSARSIAPVSQANPTALSQSSQFHRFQSVESIPLLSVSRVNPTANPVLQLRVRR